MSTLKIRRAQAIGCRAMKPTSIMRHYDYDGDIATANRKRQRQRTLRPCGRTPPPPPPSMTS